MGEFYDVGGGRLVPADEFLSGESGYAVGFGPVVPDAEVDANNLEFWQGFIADPQNADWLAQHPEYRDRFPDAVPPKLQNQVDSFHPEPQRSGEMTIDEETALAMGAFYDEGVPFRIPNYQEEAIAYYKEKSRLEQAAAETTDNMDER